MKYSKWIMCAIFFVGVFGLENPICSEKCTCFHEQTESVSIANCSLRSLRKVPQTIPENITELYLDGSYLPSMKRNAFINNKKLKTLHINHCNIATIEKGTFYGLKELEILRLDWNSLYELNGYEFEGLIELKILYLDYNRIGSISNSTFTDLKLLTVLHLAHNLIIDFNVWNLPGSLKEVTLASNPWSCDCEYTKKLREWMIKSNAVLDLNEVKCLYDDKIIFIYDFHHLDYVNNTEFGFYIHKNDSACTNATKIDYSVNGEVEND